MMCQDKESGSMWDVGGQATGSMSERLVHQGHVVCGGTKRISMDNGLVVCGDISG